jgi:opacity protein-like surface antigen
MKKSIAAGVSAAALMLSASIATAADYEPVPPIIGCGWYVSLFGGLSLLDDFKTDYSSSGISYSESLDTKEGFVIGGAAGTCLNENLRTDVEVAYSHNRARDFTGSPYDVDGDLESLTVLGNLWYDIKTGSMFTPYFGGGAGVGVVWGDYNYDPPLVPPGQIVDDSDLGLAFQLGAGVNINLTESFDLTLGYRFKGIVDLELDSTFLAATPHEGDLYSHNFIAGLVWKFPAPY